MSKSQWFVEPLDPGSNESIAHLLSMHGFGAESFALGVLDTKGKPHDGWWVPSEFVVRLKRARKSNSGVHYRLWNRGNSNQHISSAEFIFRERKPSKVRKILAEASAIKAN